ncbi:PREDICTED: proline-rich protein 36-like [Eufriesea mexicana]|uniref:proline-rich protein 36-like n=1 Tax=Eufriesea mexicana TaxID=516756 RepID=UPI00083C7ACF|nr:PREDICTED: proline-rich protein 36-like [Eufriesea mexicana]
MKFLLITCLLVASLLCVKAGAETEEREEKPEITKLELVDLGEGESDIDDKDSEVQKKRDSGYSYRRPETSSALASRARFQIGQSGNRGRIVNRHPAQINRPVTKYGPPGYQNSSPMRPTSHGQQHRDKLQSHGHFGQQHSNFDGRPSGLFEQEVPSPIRQVDFVEPNPISSQNNEPFGIHTANYLPPQNQKLPGYSVPQIFSSSQVTQSPNNGNEGPSANFQSQNIVQPQGQISDAALFLTQNAQAIQQLYAAPPNEQDFAPQVDQFLGHNNQVPNANIQFQNFESSSQSPASFPGQLPSYASGTLSAQETLEQIQSHEKDRLIVQLQRALATQTQAQNADAAGRYAQNQPSFVQNQDLLASLGQRMKIHGLNTQQSTVNFGSGNTAFNQSPFLPGTTISPGFPLSYGLSTTIQPPTTTTTTATTTTVQPPQAAKGDGTSQVGSSVPAPPLASSAPGVPVYGGFVPTLIAGTTFLSNVPSYGSTFFAPGAVTPVQPSGSSPTQFGLPIPTNHGQKPISGTTPSSSPSITSSTPLPSRPGFPSSPPVNTVPLPVHPVATPLHPVVTPLHPVAPLQPVLPPSSTHVHPVQTPSATHPTYGLQTAVINPLLYKPIKPVYPFYYYPNVAYQVPKPASPTYPWSYAPTYAQAKPTQIWK